MHYLGGKFRIGREIVSVLKNLRKENQVYIEPFIGAGWTMIHMDGKRKGFDIHPELISLWKALQNGWIPPNEISEIEYKNAKNGECKSYLKGFIGFGCSFSGKWFGGMARSKNRNYALNAKNSLLKKVKLLQDVEFKCLDYKKVRVRDSLIYCDPPYANTTEYKNQFDSKEFWNYMRRWRERNIVVVSEYVAPSDFKCIASFPTKTDMRNKENKQDLRIEKLFM